jgi:hypothetical protein
MFISNQKKQFKGFLKFDESNFFTILSEDNDSYTVQVVYSVDHIEAIKNNLNKVKISIFSKNISPALLVQTGRTEKDLYNFLTFGQKTKKKEEERKKHFLGEFVSDITKFLNKDLISKILRGEDLRNEPFFLKKVTKYSTSFSEQNAPGVNKFYFNDPQKEKKQISLFKNKSFKLIRSKNVDPSNIPFTFREKTKIESYKGITNQSFFRQKDEYLKDVCDISENFFSTSSGKGSLISYKEFSTETKVFSEFKIKKSDTRNFFLNFELFSSNSTQILDSREFSVSLNDFQDFKNKIVLTPSVHYSFDKNRAIFSITQVDKNASGVLIFKKRVKRTKREDDIKYELVDEISLPPGETKKLYFKRPFENSEIYRFVSKNENKICPRFESKVVPSISKERDDEPIVFAKKSSFSRKIEVGISNFSNDVLALQFFIKNLTTKQQKSVPLGERINLTQEQINSENYSTLFDEPRTDNFYEISCKVFYRTGLSSIKGPFIFSLFLSSEENKEQIVVSQTSVSNSIQFEINVFQKESQTDFVKSEIFKRKEEDLFVNELKAEKQNLKNIFYFQVRRFNLKTGIVEFLGETNETKFLESDLAKKSGLVPASEFDRFEYSFSMISSPPDTFFPNTKKEVVDPLTSKRYFENTSKFKSRLNLLKGLISSNSKNFSGNVFYLTSENSRERGKFDSISIKRLNSYNRVVKIDFSVKGDPSYFDHFVLTKIINDDKVQICSFHSQFSENMSFFYELQNEDIGKISFSIISIKNDFEIDQEAISNEIFIGE